MAGRQNPNPDDSHDSHENPHDPSPLDELFIVGAQYHEPSAAERARAAREAEQRAARERKARSKRVKHTRRVLQGGAASSGFDHRTALIGFGVVVVVATLLAETGIWH
jgi:hypothetical protein